MSVNSSKGLILKANASCIHTVVGTVVEEAEAFSSTKLLTLVDELVAADSDLSYKSYSLDCQDPSDEDIRIVFNSLVVCNNILTSIINL